MDNPPIEYDFFDRLRMSQGVSASQDIADIIREAIPGICNVYPAHPTNDKNGTDQWAEHERGDHLSIDVKVREQDFSTRRVPQDDLALEIWSVVEERKIGWTRDQRKRTDYVLWFWKDTGRWCLIPFAMLCAVFQEKWRDWRRAYKTARQFTPGHNGHEGYHSECVFVPRRTVWEAIYYKFSGVPPKNGHAP